MPFRERHDYLWLRARVLWFWTRRNWVVLVYIAAIVTVTLVMVAK
jgi:hypothetical protein